MDTHDKETQTELFGTNQDLAATILDETTLVQTLIPNAASKQDKAVFGIAILGDELFASSHECPEIEVFGDLQKLERRRTFLLTGYQLENPWDLQSSSMYHCLYIVDVKRNEDDNTKIIKIDREGIAEKEWKTDCKAGRLSVTKESNVIITSLYTLKIEEYSYDGVLNRLIELRTDAGIANPWVTLKRNENEYIISHGNRGNARHGVCLINQKGSIKQSFGEKKGSANGQLFVPVHMAAYSDGHILVADKDNSRVVVLSPDFKFITTLFSRDEYLRFPNRLCLDEQNKRLFVSDNQWFSNMKPWINGKILVFDVSKVQASLNSALEKN